MDEKEIRRQERIAAFADMVMVTERRLRPWKIATYILAAIVVACLIKIFF